MQIKNIYYNYQKLFDKTLQRLKIGKYCLRKSHTQYYSLGNLRAAEERVYKSQQSFKEDVIEDDWYSEDDEFDEVN